MDNNLSITYWKQADKYELLSSYLKEELNIRNLLFSLDIHPDVWICHRKGNDGDIALFLAVGEYARSIYKSY